jgi:hypothetical protein
MGLNHHQSRFGGFIMAIKRLIISAFSIYSIAFSLEVFAADTSSDESAPSKLIQNIMVPWSNVASCF